MHRVRRPPPASPAGDCSRPQPAGRAARFLSSCQPRCAQFLECGSSLSECAQVLAHTVPSSQNTLSSPSSFIPRTGRGASPPCAHGPRVLPEHCSHPFCNHWWGLNSTLPPPREGPCLSRAPVVEKGTRSGGERGAELVALPRSTLGQRAVRGCRAVQGGQGRGVRTSGPTLTGCLLLCASAATAT